VILVKNYGQGIYDKASGRIFDISLPSVCERIMIGPRRVICGIIITLLRNVNVFGKHNFRDRRTGFSKYHRNRAFTPGVEVASEGVGKDDFTFGRPAGVGREFNPGNNDRIDGSSVIGIRDRFDFTGGGNEHTKHNQNPGYDCEKFHVILRFILIYYRMRIEVVKWLVGNIPDAIIPPEYKQPDEYQTSPNYYTCLLKNLLSIIAARRCILTRYLLDVFKCGRQQVDQVCDCSYSQNREETNKYDREYCSTGFNHIKNIKNNRAMSTLHRGERMNNYEWSQGPYRKGV